MELKPGYKQTEVGVIPEDWDVKAIDELAKVTSGKRMPLGTSLTDRPNAHPYIRISDMVPGSVRTSDLMYVPESVFPAIKRFRIFSQDIFISVAGSLGIVGKVPKELSGANLTENADRITDIACSQDYLLYFLMSPQIQGTIDAIRTVGAQPKLALSRIRKFKLAIPKSHDEQNQIAECLHEADHLLGELDLLVIKKQLIKQATMQELLTVKRRLPGFEGEWEVKRLGDVAHIKTGSRNNEDKIDDGEHPFFVRSDTVERINSYAYDCEAILVPGEGRIGEIFHYINGRFDVHQRVYAITQFKPGLSGEFVHSYMAMNFGAWAMQNSVKATVDSLRLPTFQTFEMLIPPTKDEQDAIAAVLSEMDAELAALEARRDKTCELKQGMMQELLAGKIRLT